MAGRSPLANAAAWGLVGLWLCGTAWLFWVFQLRDMRPFADDPAPFVRLQQAGAVPQGLAQRLDDLAVPGVATVVEFRDSRCRCTRFNDPHSARIRAAFESRGVRFLTEEAHAGDAVAQESVSQKLAPWLPITASPAALVIDGQGRIAYFGPFSVGAGCLSGSGDFVERALEGVLAGADRQQLNVLDMGCYCDWPDTAAHLPRERGLEAS